MFGFGGSSSDTQEDTSSLSSQDYSNSSNYDFTSDPQGAVGGGGGGRASMASIQQEIMQEQQRALIQQAVARIAEIAWDKCVGKPDTALSGRESSCIQNVARTYVDTSAFMTNRLMKGGSSKQY